MQRFGVLFGLSQVEQSGNYQTGIEQWDTKTDYIDYLVKFV
jgi:hypothetical protein